MRLVLAFAALLAAAVGLWVTGGTMAVTGTGPHAARLGLLPPLWLLGVLLLLALGAGLALWRRHATPRLWPLLAAVLILLPWWPWAVPRVFLLWTGPFAFWLWGAIVMAVWLARPARRPWPRRSHRSPEGALGCRPPGPGAVGPRLAHDRVPITKW